MFMESRASRMATMPQAVDREVDGRDARRSTNPSLSGLADDDSQSFGCLLHGPIQSP
jgi:hypothetical protein